MRPRSTEEEMSAYTCLVISVTVAALTFFTSNLGFFSVLLLSAPALLALAGAASVISTSAMASI